MTTRAEVLKLLADGAFHSGTDLGQRLDISRAAVCKAVQALADSGVAIERVSGRGYRLEVTLEPLERRRILRHLGAAADALHQRLTVLDEVDSTSRWLLELAATAPERFHGSVCLAETQPRGRGRRGRHWVTTPYHNLMLSMGWRFEAGPGALVGLSLAAGLAVVHALEAYGAHGLALKWPNDVLCEGHKLAGLLVDLQGEATGPCHVVLGLGVNGYIAPREARLIDQPWTDLRTVTGGLVERNRLAALVVARLHETLTRFADKGFALFRAEWQRRHAFHHRPVRLLQDGTVVTGRVEGVDEHGALLLSDAAGRTHTYYSGDVSLRPG